MPRRGKRKRIAKCIYESRTGRTGTYRDANGRQKELSFPPYTPISEIRDALDAAKRKNRGSAAPTQDARGTLNAAIDDWASQEQHLASWKDRRSELRAWAKLYGHLRLRAITSKHVRDALGIWTGAGVAVKTIRNRLWSLKHLYELTLGSDAETPVDDVAPPAKVRRVINPTAPAVILTVYRNLLEFERTGRLRDSKTRARYMVRAASGRRPVEIMRAQPEDVDRERRVWRVRDAKGGFSEGLYLHDDLLEAWNVFFDANAWGPFNTGSQAEVLRAAGWPSERDDRGRYRSRPYNLRHSVGITLREAGADFVDVADYLGQRDIRTTRESYVGILNSRMERAGKSLDGRLNGWQVPSVVPSIGAPARSNLLQTQDRARRAVERGKRKKTA